MTQVLLKRKVLGAHCMQVIALPISSIEVQRTQCSMSSEQGAQSTPLSFLKVPPEQMSQVLLRELQETQEIMN